MVPSEIIERVRHISFHEDAGTAFIYERRGRQYWVTAKHVVEGLETEGVVKVEHRDLWVPERIQLVGHSDFDVSVFCTSEAKYAPADDWVCKQPTYHYGQDVYFLGFPYGYAGRVGEMLQGYPLPFLRKAIVSNFSAERAVTYLDGFNNPGFSGAPGVVKTGTNRFSIAFVITAYDGQVDDLDVLPIVPDGAITESSTSPIGRVSVSSNTGLIQACSIVMVNELIDANPIGPKFDRVPAS